jgi:hypothetical protein
MPTATRLRNSVPAPTLELLDVLLAVRRGDFSIRMPYDQTGIEGKICDTLNEIIEMNQRLDAGVAAHRQRRSVKRARSLSAPFWATQPAAGSIASNR